MHNAHCTVEYIKFVQCKHLKNIKTYNETFYKYKRKIKFYLISRHPQTSSTSNATKRYHINASAPLSYT